MLVAKSTDRIVVGPNSPWATRIAQFIHASEGGCWVGEIFSTENHDKITRFVLRPGPKPTEPSRLESRFQVVPHCLPRLIKRRTRQGASHRARCRPLVPAWNFAKSRTERSLTKSQCVSQHRRTIFNLPSRFAPSANPEVVGVGARTLVRRTAACARGFWTDRRVMADERSCG